MCVWGTRQPLSVPSYPAGEEADRLKEIVLMEMTPCIGVNTPIQPCSWWSFDLAVMVNGTIFPERCKDICIQLCDFLPRDSLAVCLASRDCAQV